MRSPRWRLCFGPDRRPLRHRRRVGHRRSGWRSSLAGVLDGIDGRIARLLRAQSRFGAELDSLSRRHRVRGRAGADPVPVVAADRRRSSAGSRRLRWRSAGAAARPVQRADRCRRSAAQVGRLLTGVPAPAGAGLAFVPVYLWLVTGKEIFRAWYVVMPWVIFIAAAADLERRRPSAGRRFASAADRGCS